MKLEITKGTWTVSHFSNDNGYTSTEIHYGNDGECVAEHVHNEHDAELIADAGTTANKCQLLPSELLVQRDELLEACKELIDPLTGLVFDHVAKYIGNEQAHKIESAIEKTL